VKHQYRAQTLDRRLFGVFTGLVESNEDPEHEGRVTLRFPWLDDATISDWCRVAQPYAGPNFGAIWIPEEKTEVLVAFVHGDMNEPIVVGGLYNGEDKPPAYKNKDKQDIKMWRTKAGHEIRLDDSSKSMAIEIMTLGGHDILLDDENQVLTISTPLGNQLVLDDKGQKLELSGINGVGKLTIDAQGTITVQGKEIKVTGTSITLSAGSINVG
jgi:phage baseplate assembly protein V